jgi:hypothetical protein
MEGRGAIVEAKHSANSRQSIFQQGQRKGRFPGGNVQHYSVEDDESGIKQRGKADLVFPWNVTCRMSPCVAIQGFSFLTTAQRRSVYGQPHDTFRTIKS